MVLPKTAIAASKATILTQAIAETAKRLELNTTELGGIVGVSQSSASRMMHGAYELRENSKEWEMAALLLRLYRGLYSLVGSSDERARDWLDSRNRAFGDRMPREVIQRVEGLVAACEYVDAHRALV